MTGAAIFPRPYVMAFSAFIHRRQVSVPGQGTLLDSGVAFHAVQIRMIGVREYNIAAGYVQFHTWKLIGDDRPVGENRNEHDEGDRPH